MMTQSLNQKRIKTLTTSIYSGNGETPTKKAVLNIGLYIAVTGEI